MISNRIVLQQQQQQINSRLPRRA